MAVETVTLTRVYINDKNKEGKPLIDKNGKPYKKIAIQTQEHGTTWLSAFMKSTYDAKENWKEGDVVRIIIEENNGFMNFRLPTKVDDLEERVLAIEAALHITNDVVTTHEPSKTLAEELEQIPF